MNLMSADKAFSHPSTSATTAKRHRIVRRMTRDTVILSSNNWYAVNSFKDEARMLFVGLNDIPTTSKQAVRKISPVKEEMHLENCVKPEVVMANKEENESLEIHYSDSLIPPTKSPDKLVSEEIYTTYVKFVDIGGQSELMDMLPALTIGHGVYMLFFSLEWDLKSEIKGFFGHSLDKTPESNEGSKITLEDMLISTLSSISCSGTSADCFDHEEANISNSEILKNSESVAF